MNMQGVFLFFTKKKKEMKAEIKLINKLKKLIQALRRHSKFRSMFECVLVWVLSKPSRGALHPAGLMQVAHISRGNSEREGGGQTGSATPLCSATSTRESSDFYKGVQRPLPGSPANCTREFSDFYQGVKRSLPGSSATSTREYLSVK